MIKTELNWKVAGFAGQGIKATGELFSRVCVRHGWYTFDYTEFPSLIKGGHNTYQVHAGTQPIYSQVQKVDFLLALNKNALVFHKDELNEESIVIFDGESEKVDLEALKLPCQALNVPFISIARQVGGDTLYANNVALGACMFLMGFQLQTLLDLISEIFAKKKEEVIKTNQKAAQAGFDYAKEHGQQIFEVEKQPSRSQYLLTGNEAVALGALAGGLQFYAAYPMSPSTSILEYLADTAVNTQIVVKHTEDEISAINMAVGASFAGARSMVATSGGGFAYMVEAVGLSGVAELPLVVVDCQRPGPALGMPTWTAQGDLRFIIHASQDEFPRIVLAPGNAKEALELTKMAMNLAEEYQLPVFILSDKYLTDSRFNCDELPLQNQNTRFGFLENPVTDANGFYPRYYPTPSGVSYRTKPGTKDGTHICNSYEHDKYGFGSEEGENRVEQMEKRWRKFEKIKDIIPTQSSEITSLTNLGIISFGSTWGPIQAARQTLTRHGVQTNYLHLNWVWPFPTSQVMDFIHSCNGVIVIENNSQKQLAGLITQMTTVPIRRTINRFDGRPFYPDELVEKIKKSL